MQEIFKHANLLQTYFMIRLVLLFISLTFIQIGYSQSRYGKQLPEHSITSNVSLSGDFYVGIDNPFTVNLPGFNLESYQISTNNGEIYQDSLQLIVSPIRPGTIRFMVDDRRGEKQRYLGHLIFNVYDLPDPKLMLDTLIIEDTTVCSINQLINTDSLSIFISSDLPESSNWFTIKEFTIGYNRGGYYVANNNPGAKFSEETKSLIKEMKPGRYISFNAIIQSNTQVSKVLPVVKLLVY